jgi:WhiB family redox-sensing transcriptional regulator
VLFAHEQEIIMLAPNTLFTPLVAASSMASPDTPLVLSARRCADGNGTLTYLFFSEEFVDISRAKAICAKCSSRDTCLTDALGREEPWGVWGGELLENGRIVANKRPRGRPPVHGRNVAPIDEVPIPRHLVASVA